MKFEISELNINKIVPYENNPRDNAKTVQRVIDSIQNFGWQVPIVVDEEFIILAGHTRLKAAKLMNLDTVPVKIAKGLTESQKTAFRIMDNKAQEFSSWDTSQLAIEFDKLVGGDFDLKLTGFDFEEIQKINNALLKFDSSELDENFNEFQISEDFDN